MILKLNLTLKANVNQPHPTTNPTPITTPHPRPPTPNPQKGDLTKVFYSNGPNLVILTSTGDELSQTHDYHTHRRTDGHTARQTQATAIPECQTGLG